MGRSMRGTVGFMSSREYTCAVKYGSACSAASRPPALNAALQMPPILRTMTKSATPDSCAIFAPTTVASARAVTNRCLCLLSSAFDVLL